MNMIQDIRILITGIRFSTNLYMPLILGLERLHCSEIFVLEPSASIVFHVITAQFLF